MSRKASRYSVHLLADDGYRLLARADLEIVAPGGARVEVLGL